MEGEGHVLKDALTAKSLCPENFLADLHFALRIKGHDFPSDHGCYQLILGQPLNIVGADILGIPENRNPGCQTVHVLNTVGNKDDGRSLIAQPVCDLIKLLALFFGQRGRRLVHKQNFCFLGNCLCDFNDLLLCHRKHSNFRTGVNGGTKAFQQGSGLGIHCRPVVQAQTVLLIVADKNILRNGKMGVCG